MGTMYVVKRVLGSITSVLKGPGSAVPLEVENSGTVPVNLYFKTTNPGDTQVAAATPMPVTAASLPLPSGAATSAKQDTGNTSVASLDTKLGEVQASPTANTLLARLKTIADALAGALTAVVSGTVTATQGAAGAAAWPTTDSQAITDDSAFTPATSKVFPIGALADDAAVDSVDEGDAGILRMTLSRILRVALHTGDGNMISGVGYGSVNVPVSLRGTGSGVVDVSACADAKANPSDAIVSAALGHGFNGNSWDRARNNISSTLLASAARTAETSSADQTNMNGRALLVIVNCSAITDTPVLTPKLSVKDSISGNYFTIWTAAATITGTGTYAYLFDLGGMGGAGSFTEAVNVRVGRTWRFTMAVADADSATYSVSADVLL